MQIDTEFCLGGKSSSALVVMATADRAQHLHLIVDEENWSHSLSFWPVVNQNKYKRIVTLTTARAGERAFPATVALARNERNERARSKG